MRVVPGYGFLEEAQKLVEQAREVTGTDTDTQGGSGEQIMNVAGIGLNPWVAGGFAAATIAGIILVHKNS